MANLNLYKTFICVAEEKNLTKASEKMYVSQPAISNAIKELEVELGFELFLRKNKGKEEGIFTLNFAIEKSSWLTLLLEPTIGLLMLSMNCRNSVLQRRLHY